MHIKKPVEKTLKHFIHFSSYASLYVVIHTPEYHNRKCFSLAFFLFLAKPLNWYSPTPSNLNKHLHPTTFFAIHCNSQSFIYFTAWHPLILIFETLFLNGSYAGSIENSRTKMLKGQRNFHTVAIVCLCWHLVFVHFCRSTDIFLLPMATA